MKGNMGAAARQKSAHDPLAVNPTPSQRPNQEHTSGSPEEQVRLSETRMSLDGMEAIETSAFQRKLQKGDLSTITEQDIKEFIQVGHLALKKEENGEDNPEENGEVDITSDKMKWSHFCKLLQSALKITEPELDAIKERAKLIDGCATAAEIFRLLELSPIRMLLKQVVLDNQTNGSLSTRKEKVIDKLYLTENVRARVARDDAFGTLPVTLVYMIVFMVLVIYHLQIWNRQEQERGLEAWIHGYGKDLAGPYLATSVADVDSFWTWLADSGISAIFASERPNPDDAPPHIRVASTNYLVGDVMFTQRQNNDDLSPEWLLNSAVGKEALASGQTFLAAASGTALDLKSKGWTSDDTSDLALTYCTYSERSELFALTEIRIPISDYGLVVPKVIATAVLVHAYPQMWVIVFDVLYILLILWPLYIEVKDLGRAAMHGCDQFAAYWQLWNIVDWSAILMGFVNFGLWLACMMAMQADCLHRYTQGNTLDPQVTKLSAGESQEVHDAVTVLARLFFSLHISVALTTISIVLKFFKAFQANARLQVVTKTLTQAAEDIFHFFVVFGTIFFSFAIIGHVLFGSDLVQFYTVASSINTGVTVLMGDFGWYVDLASSDDFLPSGTPRFFLTVWFIVYMFFVLLVLLNILLALIISHYTIVEATVKGSVESGGAPTLWRQTIRYIQRARETRKFTSLGDLLVELVDDDNKTNMADDDVVTEDYLMDKLSVEKPQAEWLMRYLERQKKIDEDTAVENETQERLRRTEEFVRRIAEELHIVTLGISDCGSRLGDMEDKLTELVAEDEAPPQKEHSPDLILR